MAIKYKEKSNPSPAQVIKGLKAEPSPCSSRIQQARDRLLRTMPSIDLERAKLMTESFMKTEGESIVTRKAKAFREQCQRKTIFIQDGELIIGTPGSRIRAGMLSPDVAWQYLEEELDTISTRPQDPYLITENQKKLLREFIKPYWQGKSLKEAWLARVPDELRQIGIKTSIIDVDGKAENGPGEFTAAHELLINNGTSGMRKLIEKRLVSLDIATPGDYDKITYLNALLIVCDGINTLAERYAELAAEKAAEEREPQRKAELEKIAETCRWVSTNSARTFREALQLFWFYQISLHMEQNGYSQNPGRIDQYLYPYYKQDIEEGRLTKEAAQELLECLWVKLAEIVPLWSQWKVVYIAGYQQFLKVCCGGVTERGEDAVNELSYMILQAAIDLRLYQPALAVRYNKGKNPDSFLRKAVELLALGTGEPPIFNDEIGIRMALGMGATLAEAYNWTPGGCVEVYLPGKLSLWPDFSKINLGSIVEFVMLDGIYRLNNTRMPVPKTGDPGKFKTFSEFKDAIKIQLAHLVREIAEMGQILVGISQELRPLPVASLTFEDCIENAKDYQCGGAKYNLGPACVMVGVADLVNSMATVKKLIYDDKKLTWDKLLQALDDDFEGHEEIRQMCLSAPKYGNDIDEIDDLATDIFKFAADEVGKYTGLTGGKMVSGLFPVTANVPLGKVVGALPSGRKAWQPLADGLSPMQGTDTKGPTAILKTVSKIDHAMHVSGTLLNMKFDPSLFKDERGIRDFMGLIKSMCDLGIYHIQCNVVNNETLRAAQKEPEKYRDLMVRVAGYSAYFVELAKDVQDDIIARTIQMAPV